LLSLLFRGLWCLAVAVKYKKQTQRSSSSMTVSTTTEEASDVLVEQQQRNDDGEIVQQEQPERPASWLEDDSVLTGERLVVPEWDDPVHYRPKHGWRGRDLVHDRHAPVRITDYFVTYGPGTDIRLEAAVVHDAHPQRGGAGTQLQGIVEFTPAAESHQGFCHGGSMCSVMDDVVGWVAFCVTGACREWTGYTVQVNVKLQKPVPVNSVLLIEGVITKVERRKVFVKATLCDPAKDMAVHAECEGLVVLNKGILQTE